MGYVWRGKRTEHPCACGCGEEAPIARKTDRRYGHVKGERLSYVHGHNAVGRGRRNAATRYRAAV